MDGDIYPKIAKCKLLEKPQGPASEKNQPPNSKFRLRILLHDWMCVPRLWGNTNFSRWLPAMALSHSMLVIAASCKHVSFRQFGSLHDFGILGLLLLRITAEPVSINPVSTFTARTLRTIKWGNVLSTLQDGKRPRLCCAPRLCCLTAWPGSGVSLAGGWQLFFLVLARNGSLCFC